MISELIRPSLHEFIKKKVPDLDSKAFICFEDLGDFRKDYVKEVLEDEIGELSALDHEVIQSLEQHEILSADISKQFERTFALKQFGYASFLLKMKVPHVLKYLLYWL